MVIGVIGVNRGLPDLGPGTVSTIGRSAPSVNPSRDIPMTIQLTGFAAGRSHQGGLTGSLLDISTLPLRPRCRCRSTQSKTPRDAFVSSSVVTELPAAPDGTVLRSPIRDLPNQFGHIASVSVTAAATDTKARTIGVIEWLRV